jgi:serine/threonine protein kinase
MESQASYSTLQQGEMLNWYRIERILGRGGFGVIYLATDTNLDYRVAIKEYIPGDIATRHTNSHVHPITAEHGDIFRWGMERFIKEARNLVKFNHPNIVRVMSVFQQNSTAYMVMEFEEGEDLRSYFKNPDARSEHSLKKLILPIIEGLTEVHRLGFIHRDIKPANILVRKNGSPVLLDFGSARSASKFTQQSLTALVSVGYAPMEQYNTENDDQQGPWTDIYALGGTLYYGICGKDPVESTQRGAAILNGGKDPLIPASFLGEGKFSPEFLAAVDWALKFKIADRPQSLNDWVPALLRRGHAEAVQPQRESLESRRQNRFDTNMLNEMSDATVLSRERRSSTYDAVSAARDGSTRTGIKSFAWIALLLSGVAGGLWYLAQPTKTIGENTTEVVTAISEPADAKNNAALPANQPANNDVARAADQIAGQSATQNSVEEQAIEEQAIEKERALAREAEQQRLATEREAAARAAAERKAQQEQAAQAEQTKLAEQARLAEQERLAEEAAKAEALAEQREKDAAALAEQEKLAKIAAEKEAQRQQQLAQAEAKRQTAARTERRLKQAILSAQNSLSVGDLTAATTQLAIARSINADDTRVETLGFAVDAALQEHNKPVSDADFDKVTRMFDGLHRAIESKDAITMDRLAISSDQSKLFKALMSRFERLDIGISGIRVRNADKSISAVLTINAMVRDNGDRATPSEAYAKRTITSRRVNGGWSKIDW